MAFMRLTPLTLALAVGVLVGCGRDGPSSRFLSIATGGTGGVYYPYGGGIAKVLNEHLEGVRASAEVTAASVDNLKLIRDGKADVAFTLADTLADAVQGRGAFAGSPVPAAALAVLYSNYTHLIALERGGITAVADLRGRTVSTGSAGSGTEVIALRILAAAGLDPAKDVRRQALGASESADALKDGKIEAFFWSGGLPTAAVQDLAHSSGIRIRLIPTGELVPALRAQHGELYFPLALPPGAYPGVTAPVSVVGVANVLVVHRSMDEQLAYDITRALFEHQPELAQIHPEARNLSLATAVKGSPAPFHPGAVRYYRDKGAKLVDD
ncbi:MAG TPA: TAXI family TRAP transporter solute-binding subunit [Vicinamibacterales bacterium]|nr:TAXI family TRAP transporter solute-binding subunit [Vicinamibacterales bacterium]